MFKRYVFMEGLTSLLGSGGKFLINVAGQIKDIDGNDLPIRIDCEGNALVTCLGWDGEKEYRAIDLIALQFKNIQIPQKDFGRVVGFVLDGDKNNLHASNIGYWFKDGPIEVVERVGFYYVPSFTSLAISKSGSVIRVKDFTTVPTHRTKPKPHKNIKGGYVALGGRFSKNRPVTVTRHRLMALTFIPYPENVDSLTVNHKNGVPGDDWIENLEWVTRSENNIHAYEHDLKNQHTRVLVRNVFSTDVKEYRSISECARMLELNSETIRQRLYSSPFGKVFQDGTQIKLKNDQRDWVEIKDPKKEVEKSLLKKQVIGRNCKTLEEVNFESVREIEKTLGIVASSVSLRLNERNHTPLFGWQFKNPDQEEWKMFTEDEYLFSLRPNSFSVVARNLFTLEEKEFKSMRKAAEFFGFSGLREVLNFRNWVSEEGWQVKRSDQQWEEVNNPEELVYSLQKTILGRCIKTRKVYIANSYTKLSQISGVSVPEIKKAAMTRGNLVINGFQFRLGLSDEKWPVPPSQQHNSA